MIIEKLILGNNHKKFLFIMKQSDFPIDQINVFQKRAKQRIFIQCYRRHVQ